MKIAESVTFGGAGLDRSGMARRDPEGVAALQRDPSTRFLALWRGKPLIDAQRRDRLIWLEGGDPLPASTAAALGQNCGLPLTRGLLPP